MSWRIDEVRVGVPRPYGPNGEPSAIDKQSVRDAVAVTKTGLAGDGQGDTRRHGGAEKALHLYPHDHYSKWRREMSDIAGHFCAGAFGENLVVTGLTEADVCIGDVFRLGTARVEISQGRQPCWKLNLRFARADMARRVQDSGRTGWYFRVLEAGEVTPDGTIELIDRPAPSWPLARINQVLYADTLNFEALQTLAGLPQLSGSWRRIADRRLQSRKVEDWNARLKSPP